MTDRPFFARLKNRGIVKISGPDGRSFLQGLISNDVNLLDRQPLVYACLLTPQGKFQYDFFLSQDGDALVLECEGAKRAHDFAKLLSLYKLRTNITIEVNDSVPVYAVLGQTGPLADPRHPQMGSRTFEIPKGLEEKPFEAWDDVRIRLCVPDGSRDMVPGQSTLLECGIDKLNGCVVRQRVLHGAGTHGAHALPGADQEASLCGGSRFKS
jgi:folate-binding Fe-S cluster repair protein YgfZ